jgi:hypothetical protein
MRRGGTWRGTSALRDGGILPATGCDKGQQPQAGSNNERFPGDQRVVVLHVLPSHRGVISQPRPLRRGCLRRLPRLGKQLLSHRSGDAGGSCHTGGGSAGSSDAGGRAYSAFTAPSTLVRDSLASPNSRVVCGSYISSFSIPANPGRMERFRKTTCRASETSRMGIP